MSVTVANLITNFNTAIGDTSNDRITQAERFQFLSESVAWLQEQLGNDHLNNSAPISYFDTVYTYKITATVPSVLDVCDLTRKEGDHNQSFARKSPRELKEEIGQSATESSFALDRVNSDWYLLINHTSKYPARMVSSHDSLTLDGGTWAVDAVNSDANNLTIDTNEYTEGGGSFNFDVTVAQSGNNRATVQNTGLNTIDLADYQDLASFIVDVYIPNVTNFSSVTLYWGQSASACWSVTATTDINGNAFVNGWNTLRFNWQTATLTGTPTTNITFVRYDFNYTVSQTNDTDFRIDDLRVVRPEPLTFVYTDWAVGRNNSGAKIYAFGATTDVPYFSDKYDHYRYAVERKAASLAFRSLRLYNESEREEVEAISQVARIRKIVPSSRVAEVKSFKPIGISFRRRIR